MNRNSTTTTTITTTTGRTVVLSHRNSLGGFANALRRAGLTGSDIASSAQGLPESDRVG